MVSRMRRCRRQLQCLACLVALLLSPTAAPCQDIPAEALRYWQFYNNAGWSYLHKRDYVRAEERFRLAIEAIRPYQVNEQRLLARSYNDLARVLYHEGRYAEAEPLAKWALSVREGHPKLNPDAVFQSLYTLALIHSAQSHYAQAEPLL